MGGWEGGRINININIINIKSPTMRNGQKKKAEKQASSSSSINTSANLTNDGPGEDERSTAATMPKQAAAVRIARIVQRVKKDGNFESESERATRVRKQAGTLFERRRDERAADERKRDYMPNKTLHALGIDQKADSIEYNKDAPAADRWKHVENYNQHLLDLSDLIHACPSCKERKLDLIE